MSLEELGLSNYEARAYLTLIKKGALSASQLAYYANLPRAKAYSTITKLCKKGLALVTQDKPILCKVVFPEEALGELLSTQERKVNDMKNMLEKLQKLSQDSNRMRGAEQGAYLIMNPDFADDLKRTNQRGRRYRLCSRLLGFKDNIAVQRCNGKICGKRCNHENSRG